MAFEKVPLICDSLTQGIAFVNLINVPNNAKDLQSNIWKTLK